MQVQTTARATREIPSFKEADHKRRICELARLIDELSGEMGSAAFRDAIRKHGYGGHHPAVARIPGAERQGGRRRHGEGRQRWCPVR